MRTRKAFVFSLDAFVAFVLTVAALYSLLFFSTVPSAYYSSLMQANYLAKDTLSTLAATSLSSDEFGCDKGQTYLSCIISSLESGSMEPAREYIGSASSLSPQEQHLVSLVPPQFGYKIEVIEYAGYGEGESGVSDTGPYGESAYGEGSWTLLYDTREDPDSANKKEYNKLKAAAHALYFGYDEYPDEGENDLRYLTCGGAYTICNWPEPFEYDGEYDSEANAEIAGKAYAYVVRFTVYT